MLYVIAAAVNRTFSKRCKLDMPRVKVESMPIKWRLAVLMADREVDYKQLANMTEMHQVTVSKHKNMRVMPERLERETLEKYCKALNCQPGELLVYMPDVLNDDRHQA
jgi:putative transcriptional regulator